MGRWACWRNCELHIGRCLLTLPVVAVGALALVIFLGMVFTLPPGPLCDEGMWLFMEGGCDWGESNVFFHGKLGLLVVENAVLAAVCCACASTRARSFLTSAC